MKFLKYFVRKKKALDIEKKTESGSFLSPTFETEIKSELVQNKYDVSDSKPENSDVIKLKVDEKETESPIINEKLEAVNSYNPTLDLKNYEYPNQNLFSDAPTIDFVEELRKNSKDMKLPVMWSIDPKSKIVSIKDLFELKNILIVGSLATGKTTFLHQLIGSLLVTKHPSQLKLVLVDPKEVELNVYEKIEKHFLAKLNSNGDCIINDGSKLESTLNALCIEMDNRYDLLKDALVTNVSDYNSKFIERHLNPEKGHQFLPFIILIIDDFGAFFYEKTKLFDVPIQRLVNDGYKVGIFTIIITSQFFGNVLSNGILSQIHQRVVFRLNNKDDYRRFLDTIKVDRFLAEGEFLFNDMNAIEKGYALQLPFHEIKKVVEFIGMQPGYTDAFLLPEYVDQKEFENKSFDAADRDPLFEDAARLIVTTQSGSTSLLQRRMKLGYNRAGHLMDQLEAAGIVGPNQGSKVRDVLVKTDAELQQYLV